MGGRRSRSVTQGDHFGKTAGTREHREIFEGNKGSRTSQGDPHIAGTGPVYPTRNSEQTECG